MTTATAIWPTATELSAVRGSIDRAVQAIEELAGDLRPYEEFDDFPPAESPPLPTDEQFVALSIFIAIATQDLSSLESYLESVRRAHSETACALANEQARSRWEAGDDAR